MSFHFDPLGPGYFFSEGPHHGEMMPLGMVHLREDGWPVDRVDMPDGSSYLLARTVFDGERRFMGAVYHYQDDA